MDRSLLFRLILDGKTAGYELHSNGHICHGDDPICYDWQSIAQRWIKHDSKDQYIGSKDRHQASIFEGDLLDVEHKPGERKTIEIRFVRGCFARRTLSLGSQLGLGFDACDVGPWENLWYGGLSQYEIVGTIHEGITRCG